MTADCSGASAGASAPRFRSTSVSAEPRSSFRSATVRLVRARRTAASIQDARRYGQKTQERQAALHRHAAARVHQRGHGVQRVGGHGHGAEPRAVLLPVQAGRLGPARAPVRADRDAHRLPELSPAGRDLGDARGRVGGARGRALRAAGQRRLALAAARVARRAAIRTGQDRDHLLHGGAARAADGSHRRDWLLAAPDRRHRGRGRGRSSWPNRTSAPP